MKRDASELTDAIDRGAVHVRLTDLPKGVELIDVVIHDTVQIPLNRIATSIDEWSSEIAESLNVIGDALCHLTKALERLADVQEEAHK